MLLNLVKAVNCMKTFEIKEIKSIRDIDSYLKDNNLDKKHRCNTSLRKQKHSNTQNGNYPVYEEDHDEENAESMYNFPIKEDSVQNFMLKLSKQEELMKIVALGSEDNLKNFKKFIMNDPKRNIFSKSERHRYFVNEATSEGYTFLYQACINGNINYIKLLLDCDADHLIKCGKKKEEQISILDAAVRWNHSKVVNYLLFDNEFKLDWPKDYLKSALKIANSIDNKNLIKSLKKALSMNNKSTFCFFLCG